MKIIIGESSINKNVYYYLGDKGYFVSCNKDKNKRPKDLEPEMLFKNEKSAIDFLKTRKFSLRSWRPDVKWSIKNKFN